MESMVKQKMTKEILTAEDKSREELEKEFLDKDLEFRNFIKLAFCLDGEVKFIGLETRQSVVYELTDSKRGKFFLGVSR